LDEREDGDVRAEAQRECQHGHRREPRPLLQTAKRQANVGEDVVQRHGRWTAWRRVAFTRRAGALPSVMRDAGVQTRMAPSGSVSIPAARRTAFTMALMSYGLPTISYASV